MVMGVGSFGLGKFVVPSVWPCLPEINRLLQHREERRFAQQQFSRRSSVVGSGRRLDQWSRISSACQKPVFHRVTGVPEDMERRAPCDHLPSKFAYVLCAIQSRRIFRLVILEYPLEVITHGLSRNVRATLTARIGKAVQVSRQHPLREYLRWFRKAGHLATLANAGMQVKRPGLALALAVRLLLDRIRRGKQCKG